MPFDPSKPIEGTEIDAAELRSQFTGLHDMIVSIPAGPPGPPGPSLVSAVVDSVSTAPSGSGSSASVFVDGGGQAHFTFTLVEGPSGPIGEVSFGFLSGEIANVTSVCLNGSSNNSNAVGTLDAPMSGDAEILRVKLNELILALRR